MDLKGKRNSFDRSTKHPYFEITNWIYLLSYNEIQTCDLRYRNSMINHSATDQCIQNGQIKISLFYARF